MLQRRGRMPRRLVERRHASLAAVFRPLARGTVLLMQCSFDAQFVGYSPAVNVFGLIQEAP